MAKQLIADLYGCDFKILNNEHKIKEIAKLIIEDIGAKIVEECVHVFKPIGITYFAVITTSHFSIHTWPEHGYAAIDLFSCSEFLREEFLEELKVYFKARNMKVNIIERRVEAE